MPLLRPSYPHSSAQRRVTRIAVIGLAAIGMALGAWQANDCAAIRFGYAAGYAYAAAVFYAVALCGVGLVLLIYWRTRGVGAGFVAAGLLSCAAFYGGMAVLVRLDRVAWRHEPPPVAIGPDQKATLVVYFRRGTTDKQIEEFGSSVAKDTTEQSLLREYLRLSPSQANGYDAVALTLSEEARPEQITRYIEMIERDSRVEKTYRDIAPTAIQPQPNRTQTPR
jgi:hypothetical protein